MADVIMDFNGKRKRVPADRVAYFRDQKGGVVVDAATPSPAPATPAPKPAEELSAFERFGRAHIDAGKALLTGAGVGAAMGKDDDLAGTAAALGAATQQDMDAGKPMSALRRVLGTAAPILAPGLGLSGLAISKFEQMRSDEAAPGARESAALGQREKVAKSFEESPVLTGAGMLAGGALTGGASAAAPRTAYRIAPTMAQRAAAAFPSGFVTGYEGNDDGNTQERIASGLGGGVLSSGIAGAAPVVLGAAGRGLDRLGNMTLRPKHVSPTAWQQFDKAIAAYDDPGLLAGAAKTGARAKTGGLSDLAVKGAKVLRRKIGPAPKVKASPDDVAGYAAKPSKVDDALMQKMTGGADLVDDLAASADDVAGDEALAALKAKMAAEEAPIVLRKKINPVGPEDIIDDVAPSAAPVPESTPTPRPMTPAEMEAAISRLPRRGQTPRPSALDDELEAVGADIREGRAPDLEGADVDPFVTSPAREATAVQRGRTPRPAPMPDPEVMPDDFVDEGVSVLRQIPGRRAAPQLEAGPETLQLEGRGDVPALPARPAQRQLEAPAPVLRQRKPRLTDDEAAAKIRAMALEHGTLDTATLSAKSGLSSSQVSRVLPRISRSAAFRNEVAAVGGRAVDPPPRAAPPAEPPDAPISMPANQLEDWGTRPAAPSSPQANAARNQGFIPPDLLDAQIARTKDARSAVAASHGQLSKQFKNMEPEKAVGRQRSAVEFDPNSPGAAPIATPKGRNRSAAPFQGEDWAPREAAAAAAPAAVVDDVAAPVVAKPVPPSSDDFEALKKSYRQGGRGPINELKDIAKNSGDPRDFDNLADLYDKIATDIQRQYGAWATRATRKEAADARNFARNLRLLEKEQAALDEAWNEFVSPGQAARRAADEQRAAEAAAAPKAQPQAPAATRAESPQRVAVQRTGDETRRIEDSFGKKQPTSEQLDELAAAYDRYAAALADYHGGGGVYKDPDVQRALAKAERLRALAQQQASAPAAILRPKKKATR